MKNYFFDDLANNCDFAVKNKEYYRGGKVVGPQTEANVQKEIQLTESVEKTLERIIGDNKLPALTLMMAKFNPSVFGDPKITPRMEEALIVLPRILELIREGIHPRMVVAMLKATVGEVVWGTVYTIRLEHYLSKLNKDVELRQEVWGSNDHVTLYVAKAILSDVIEDIDIFNPSENDCSRSCTKKTAERFKL